MKMKSLFLTTVASIVFATSHAAAETQVSVPQDSNLIVYIDGKAMKTSTLAPIFQHIQAECEKSFLDTTNSNLRLLEQSESLLFTSANEGEKVTGIIKGNFDVVSIEKAIESVANKNQNPVSTKKTENGKFYVNDASAVGVRKEAIAFGSNLESAQSILSGKGTKTVDIQGLSQSGHGPTLLMAYFENKKLLSEKVALSNNPFGGIKSAALSVSEADKNVVFKLYANVINEETATALQAQIQGYANMFSVMMAQENPDAAEVFRLIKVTRSGSNLSCTLSQPSAKLAEAIKTGLEQQAQRQRITDSSSQN